MELHSLTAHKLNKLIRDKKTCSVEITKNIYNRKEKLDKKINSYITLSKELALKEAGYKFEVGSGIKAALEALSR